MALGFNPALFPPSAMLASLPLASAPAPFLPCQAPAHVPMVSTAGHTVVSDPVQKRAEFVLVTDSALVPDLLPVPSQITVSVGLRN